MQKTKAKARKQDGKPDLSEWGFDAIVEQQTKAAEILQKALADFTDTLDDTTLIDKMVKEATALALDQTLDEDVFTSLGSKDGNNLQFTINLDLAGKTYAWTDTIRPTADTFETADPEEARLLANALRAAADAAEKVAARLETALR